MNCNRKWGRGTIFYHVILNSATEQTAVWGRGSITLKPGILCLQRWSPDFDPATQKSSHTQLWVRFLKLPWEYWHTSILTSIAKSLRVPLKLDNATTLGEFGHYARILIDIDLSSPLPEQLLIERVGRSFFINIVYESLPTFCNICSNIGHSAHECCHAQHPSHSVAPRPKNDKPDSTKRVWKPKPQAGNAEITTVNAFQALYSDIQDIETAKVDDHTLIQDTNDEGSAGKTETTPPTASQANPHHPLSDDRNSLSLAAILPRQTDDMESNIAKSQKETEFVAHANIVNKEDTSMRQTNVEFSNNRLEGTNLLTHADLVEKQQVNNSLQPRIVGNLSQKHADTSHYSLHQPRKCSTDATNSLMLLESRYAQNPIQNLQADNEFSLAKLITHSLQQNHEKLKELPSTSPLHGNSSLHDMEVAAPLRPPESANQNLQNQTEADEVVLEKLSSTWKSSSKPQTHKV